MVRNHKAEYARAKERATKAGYSVREYKTVRAASKLPRNASPIPKRILLRNTDLPIQQTAADWARRRESEQWSREHSRKPQSKYSPKLSPYGVEKYHKTFVDKNPDTAKWKRDLYEWLYDDVEDAPDYDEWQQSYFA